MEILQCGFKVKPKRHPKREISDNAEMDSLCLAAYRGGWQERAGSLASDINMTCQ